MKPAAVRQARWSVLAVLLSASACATFAPPPPLPIDFVEEGRATYYGSPSSNRRGGVSNAREWDPGMTTASHRSLPIGTCINVYNLESGREARVRVTDRGAYTPGIIVDLSYQAARRVGLLDSRNGTARVRLTPCG